MDSFDFDPLMNTTSFSAEVAGCLFVVSWQGAGEIVPFEGHGAATGGDEDGEFDWDATLFVTGSVFGEVSRTADADIQTSPADEDPSCLTYARTGAPGYLTQGAAAGENTAEGRLN